MEKIDIAIGVLSFKAYKTIDNSLEKNIEFFKNFADVKLFFQSFSENDKTIAEKYNINYLKIDKNIGIQKGIRWLVENLYSDYVIYLENDFILSCDPRDAMQILKKSLYLIKEQKIDMMRLRSRFNPGKPFIDIEKYTKLFKPVSIHPDFNYYSEIKKTSVFAKLEHIFRPLKTKKISARSLYIEKEPEKICKQITKYDDTTYIVNSEVLNWTNNPTLISKKLFLELLDYADAHPSSRLVNGYQDLEKPLNCRWWRNQHFKIGVCDGIFTHNRLDR